MHRLAWRQLKSERLRLLAAVAGITFAVLLQLIQLGFRDALFTSSTLMHTRLQGDIALISSQYESISSAGSFPRRRLYQTQMLDAVDSVAPLHISLAPLKDPVSFQDRMVMVLAFDPDNPVFDLSALGANVDAIRTTDTALIDENSRPEFRPVLEMFATGPVVSTELMNHRLDLTGKFKLGVSFAGNAHLLMNEVTFRRMFSRPEGTIEVGVVRLKPGSDVEAVRATLASMLPPDVKVLTRQQFVDLEQQYWGRSTPIGFVFGMGLLVGLMVGSVIVYQILYTDVNDHLPEYATLKAMGYTDRSLYLVVLHEAWMLSMLGFPIGLLIATGLYSLAQDATKLPIFMTTQKAVTVFTLTLTMCVVSGLLAVRKLRSADPADAF